MGRTERLIGVKTRACDVGLCHVFLNLKGREPGGIVAVKDYESVRRDLIAALMEYKDEKTGQHPFALALSRENAEMVNLWSDLVGDVVYALHPEFDGAHGKQLPSASFGMAGQHSTFVIAGAGIKKTGKLEKQVRSIDVAPTICYLTGVPMPAQVEGGVVYEALENPDWHLK